MHARMQMYANYWQLSNVDQSIFWRKVRKFPNLCAFGCISAELTRLFFVARISNPVRNKNMKKIHVQESALTYYDGEKSKSLSRKSGTRVSAVGYE